MRTEVKILRRKQTGDVPRGTNKDFESEVEKPEKPSRAVLRAEERAALISVDEKVAQDKTLVYQNWVYPGGMKEFPQDADMRWVKKCYPFASPSMLLVDEATNKYQVDKCKKKAEAMKRLGHRYLYLTPGMTFEDALIQLGELEGAK